MPFADVSDPDAVREAIKEFDSKSWKLRISFRTVDPRRIMSAMDFSFGHSLVYRICSLRNHK
jgi:hypothetical protein